MTRRTTYTLLYPGTLVTAIVGGHQAYGRVDGYEHYNPHQFTFPVKFGNTTKIMTSAEVTVLPDGQQHGDRRPPRHTGYYGHRDCSSCD